MFSPRQFFYSHPDGKAWGRPEEVLAHAVVAVATAAAAPGAPPGGKITFPKNMCFHYIFVIFLTCCWTLQRTSAPAAAAASASPLVPLAPSSTGSQTPRSSPSAGCCCQLPSEKKSFMAKFSNSNCFLITCPAERMSNMFCGLALPPSSPNSSSARLC